MRKIVFGIIAFQRKRHLNIIKCQNEKRPQMHLQMQRFCNNNHIITKPYNLLQQIPSHPEFTPGFWGHNGIGDNKTSDPDVHKTSSIGLCFTESPWKHLEIHSQYHDGCGYVHKGSEVCYKRPML